MKLVRALEEGYDNITVRVKGEEFYMPDDVKAPWFEDASLPKKDETFRIGQPQALDAKTLSGIQSQQSPGAANDLV